MQNEFYLDYELINSLWQRSHFTQFYRTIIQILYKYVCMLLLYEKEWSDQDTILNVTWQLIHCAVLRDIVPWLDDWNQNEHIEAETKWPQISWHFQMHFVEWKYINFRIRFHWSFFLRVQLTIFHHWTFFENIGFNTVPTDPFMSHLATQLGYSAGEFQALQLIVLATFGVVD